MVEKLSVTIALEGGAEVERQLADIGKAGQEAFAEIEKSATKVGGFKNLKPEQVTAQLKTMGVEGTAAVGKIQAAVATASRFEKLVLGVQSVEAGFAAVRQAAVAAAPVIASIGVVAAGAFVAAQKSTIAFAQSIAQVSAEAIKLGLSFQEFDAARKRLEGLGFSADAISAGFTHVHDAIQRMQLERVKRDAEAVKKGFGGSRLALERLKTTALEFTPAGIAAAEALRSMGERLPGLAEADIRKYGIELAKLKAIIERITGQKIEIDISADPAQQIEEIQELLKLLPEGAERTAIAFRLLGPALGAETIQKLRLMEGSLPPIEANALKLQEAINRLQAAWGGFGSVTFAPFITAEINAVTSALQQLQSMIGNFSWATFSDAAIAAGNALKYFSIQGLAALGLQWAWDLSGIDALITKIGQAARAWLEYFGIASKAGGTPLPGGAPIGGPGGGIGSNARGGLLGGRGSGTSDSNLAWVSRGEYIMPARVVAKPGIASFLEALRRSGGIPGFARGGFADGGSVGFVRAQSVEQIVQAINSLAQSIDGAFQLVARQDTLTQGIDAILQAIGSIRGRAAGGLLGGRGSGTSDSNLAWVSRGEHIMPARAVRQPGVLAFLEALRRSGGNLADVLDGMGRFALGGMVPRAIPAFASGGLAGGGSHVTIQFPGLPAIGGLRASSEVVGELQKAAALAQVRSGGRKPSRYT